ncbi:MAG TPA: DUF6340 family protein [Bacteroidales bacterium]|nr:DUF6340 family protein [Bacteroidales bacterium]
MRKLLHQALFILAVGSLFSCKTTQVSVEVLKPAQITIPSQIKSIAIINGSTPSKRDRARNVMEGLITGEVPFVDKRAAEQCITGVVNRLQGAPRFKSAVLTGIQIKGTGTRQFPAPLDWNYVDEICRNSNVDAIAVLEVFDSNNMYSQSEREAKRKEGDKEIKYTEYIAHLNVEIEAGWRIYYPEKQQIIDQNIYNDSREWNNASNTPKKAQAGLPALESAVSDAGYYAGQQYAVRISPLWIWVTRQYYKKGNTDFELATRKAKVNDWKGAAELWQKHINNSDPKIAGYANYNMALACEMEGDLESALDWAQKSYVNYKNNSARYYVNILKQRINDQVRLQEQMDGSND